MRKVDRMNDVISYNLFDGKLITVRKDGIYLEANSLLIDGDYTGIRIFNRYVITQERNETNLIFFNPEQKNGKVVISGDGQYILWRSVIFNNRFFVPIVSENGTFHLLIDEFLTKKFFKLNRTVGGIIGDYGFYRLKNILYGIKLFSQDIKLKYSFDENCLVNEPFYFSNENLILSTSDKKLSCISSHDGILKWELSDCLQFYSQHPISGNLYGFHGERYQVIDTLKGEKIVDTIFEGSKEKYKILPSQNVNKVYEDGLYFVSNTYGCKFGKIDIENHCIDFVQDLGVKPGVEAYTPTYKDGKIYILDSEKTLHIFEKE